jgi:hypothetical protein
VYFEANCVPTFCTVKSTKSPSRAGGFGKLYVYQKSMDKFQTLYSFDTCVVYRYRNSILSLIVSCV